MKLVAGNEQFQVYDDVLSSEQFTDLWKYVQLVKYESVHKNGWNTVWRLEDGSPLAGPGIYSENSWSNDSKLKHLELKKLLVYPTQTAIDILMDLIQKNSDAFTALVGIKGKHWHAFTARAYLYPEGTGLSWHRDSQGYTGAYSYYAHPEWNTQWGGELFVAHPSCKDRDTSNGEISTVDWKGDQISYIGRASIGSHLDNRKENTVLGEIGLGHYIFAKPNRLVILSGGHPHKINRVTPSAGNRVRCSISGFFLSRTAIRTELSQNQM